MNKQQHLETIAKDSRDMVEDNRRDFRRTVVIAIAAVTGAILLTNACEAYELNTQSYSQTAYSKSNI